MLDRFRRTRLSLQARLILASALAIGLTSMVGVFCLFEMKKIASTTSDITETWVPSIQAVAEIRVRLQTLRVAELKLLGQAEAGLGTKLTEQSESIIGELFIYGKSLSGLIQEDESQTAFDAYSAAWDKYSASHDEFVKLVQEGKYQEARKSVEAMEVTFEEAQIQIKALDELSYKGSLRAKESANELLSLARMKALIALPMILLLALASVWLVTRKTGKRINNVAHNLNSMAEKLRAKGNGLSMTSARLSQSTTQEAAAIQETSATIAMINDNIKHSTTLTASASEAIEKTRDHANTGRRSIDQVSGAMNEIDESNRDILNHVEQNNRSMEEIIRIMHSIEDKTKVINDIVFQTKLLSFNASVEAARAGESGKGFSVVAEEIANLAQVSGTAAKDISVILESSSSKVKEIVGETMTRISGAVQSSSAKIRNGIELTHGCSRALDEIVATAQHASEMAKEISESSNQQAQGINEITTAMSELTQATQQNSTLAETTASESKDLMADSDVLAQVITDLETAIHGSSRKPEAPIDSSSVHRNSGEGEDSGSQFSNAA